MIIFSNKNSLNIYILVLLLITFGSVAQQASYLEPLAVYRKDGIAVRAYDYKSFEPFLKRNNDTIYVINFWATWCQPCIKELPYFEKLNTDYKNRKVKVILVSLDIKKQVESNLIPFIKRKNLQSEVIFLNDPDANSWISKIDPNWSGAIPATIIYNNNRSKFYEQSFTFEQLEKEIKSFNNQ